MMEKVISVSSMKEQESPLNEKKRIFSLNLNKTGSFKRTAVQYKFLLKTNIQ